MSRRRTSRRRRRRCRRKSRGGGGGISSSGTMASGLPLRPHCSRYARTAAATPALQLRARHEHVPPVSAWAGPSESDASPP
jgi:hypothetical protein